MQPVGQPRLQNATAPEQPQTLNPLVKKFLDIFTGSLKEKQPAAIENLRNKITDITPLKKFIDEQIDELVDPTFAPYLKTVSWNFYSNIADKLNSTSPNKMTPEQFMEESKKLFGAFCNTELNAIDRQEGKHNFSSSIDHFFETFLPVGFWHKAALKLAMPFFNRQAEDIYNDLSRDPKERVSQLTAPLFDIFEEAPPAIPAAIKRETPKPAQEVRRFKLPPVTKDEELGWVMLKGAKMALGALQGTLTSQAREVKVQLKNQIEDFDLVENFMDSQFESMRQSMIQKELLHTTKAQQQLQAELTELRPNAAWVVIGNIAGKVIKPGEKITMAEFNTRAQAFLQTFAVEQLKQIQAGELDAEAIKPVIENAIQTFYPITGPLKALLNLFMGRIAKDAVKVYKTLMQETAGMTNEQRVQYVLFPYLEVLQTYLPTAFEEKIELPPVPAEHIEEAPARIPLKDRVKVIKSSNRFSNFFKNLWKSVRNTFARIFSKAP